jgi:hypothetical protein
MGITVVAAADLILYAFLLAQPGGPLGQQAGPAGHRALFVAGYLALLAVLGVTGTHVSRPAARLLIFGFTAGAGLGMGVLGMASIGPPLLLISALSVVAITQVAERTWGPIVTGVYAAFVVLLLGIGFTG